MKNKSVNRRDFLRLSAAAGAGVVFAPGVSASTSGVAALSQKNVFPVRTLGKTGLKLPILSMGVMRADNPNVVKAAYNAGITHFDTAHGYQNGRNEEMLGNFFKGLRRGYIFHPVFLPKAVGIAKSGDAAFSTHTRSGKDN
jgi:hypothetical protein